MQMQLDVYTGQRYRVFANRGNILSSDGITVTVALIEDNWAEMVFNFWTREDAVTFFANMALAARITSADEDDDRPGAHLIIEAVTSSSEHLAAVGGRSEAPV